MICVLSKALTGVWYAEIGEIVKQLGFEGVDFTMMHGGMVEPSDAPVDEVRALESVHGAGLQAPIMTTALISPAEPWCRTLLALAGRTGVGLFKAGFNRTNATPLTRREAFGLAYVGKEYEIGLNVIAGSGANHSNLYPILDAQALIDGLDPQWSGLALHAECFASTNAASEGDLRTALPQVKSVIVADFAVRAGTAAKEWKPLGQGSVDFDRMFHRLAGAGFVGPITVERDYKTSDEPGALGRDAEFVRKHIAAAYGAPKS
jgi:sugar phosphate isomerase/epimerase